MSETTIEISELTNGNEKPYTLKKLCADNIFTFATILNKVGFKEIKSCINSDSIAAIIKAEKNKEESVDVEKIGMSIMMDIVSIVITNLESCKDSIYKLLADLSGMKTSEIATLDMNVFIEMIIDVFQKEEFKDFFKVVSKFLK